VLLALTGLPLTAHAACPTDLEAAAVAAAIVARQPVPVPAREMSVADGLCGRDKVVRYLAQISGPVVGYKAGLTNLAVQQRFKHDAPLRGTLFQGMLLRDGAELAVDYGIRPVFEADLVVEVADPAALAKADTPLAALKALKSYAPFIELPDLMVADPSKLGGAMLAMVNVGARAGVLGKATPIQPSPGLADTFATMTVTLTDATGAVLDTGKGRAILGNPLTAASWLARDLASAGIPLKRGDLLSLGSFTKLLPPKPGLVVKATYAGLPGNPGVSVRFR
jgi:2-keto-4-pentenoate hydratase